MRGEYVFTEIIHEMPSTLCLSPRPSITPARGALSPRPQASAFFYLREPFSAAVWFKFPHQRGKPLIALLNEALNPQLLPWNYTASTSKSLQTFRG